MPEEKSSNVDLRLVKPGMWIRVEFEKDDPTDVGLVLDYPIDRCTLRCFFPRNIGPDCNGIESVHQDQVIEVLTFVEIPT